MRILAVSAHPDDLEIACAGTLARYVREGHDVTMCNVASGNRGSFEHSSEEIGAIRLEEAQRAAKIIGAQHLTANIPDTEVDSQNPAHRRLLVDIIRQVNPDVVLTHPDNDYMTDHIETSRLVEDTSFIASVPLYESEFAPIGKVPALYHFDNARGINFIPTEYVDISEVLDVKLKALAEHKSQLGWIKDHTGFDILDSVQVAAQFRGYQCGVAAAEGFRGSLKHLRQRPARLLP